MARNGQRNIFNLRIFIGLSLIPLVMLNNYFDFYEDDYDLTEDVLCKFLKLNLLF